MTMELKKRILTSIILLIFLYFVFINKFVLLVGLIIFCTIVWVEFSALISKVIKLKNLNYFMSRFFFQSIFSIYLLLFSIVFWKSFSEETNKFFLLFVLGICVATDIGGLVFGKFFKGRKITKISPNKTISGLIGSFIFSLILMFIFMEMSSTNYDYRLLIFLTLIVSSSSQLGDLLFSYIKRTANVKDTGDLLPGHGGFLDRFDGILFGFPIGFVFSISVNII